MPRGKASSGGSVTVNAQTVKDLVAQVTELRKDIAAMRLVIGSGGGAPAKGASTGPKKPRRVNALKFYLEEVIDKCKDAAFKKNKNLKALQLYMAGKKIASAKFEKLPAKDKAKYEKMAGAENDKNGVGTTPKARAPASTGSKKGKQSSKKKPEPESEGSESESGESESESEGSEVSGSEAESESGSESEGESSSEGESGFEELLSEEEVTPPKKGGKKGGQKGKGRGGKKK